MARAAPLVLVLVAFVLAAGCATREGYNRAPDASTSNSTSLEKDAFTVLPIDEERAAHVRATVTSPAGAVDAWLAHGSGCDAIGGPPAFDATSSARNVTSATLERDVAAGRTCLVLDNAVDSFGGAAPTGQADIHYRIEVWRAK